MKKNIIIKKLKSIKIIIYFSLFILLFLLGYTCLYNNNYYLTMLDKINNNFYKTKTAPRGRIYDRNGVLLVDNKLVPVLYYNNVNKNDNLKEIEIAKILINIIDIDYSKVTKKALKEYYLTNNSCDYLITDEEFKSLDNKKITEKDIYNLKIDRLQDSVVDKLNENEKKLAYLYHLMHNGYSYDFKVIKKNGLTDKEIASITDNYNNLDGFFIDYDYERVFLYGNTFKSILGNVSTISSEDKDYYLKKGYNLDDLVGSSFIEKQYENYLHGEKGLYKIENKKIIKIKDGTYSKDIYLTIDIKLQQEIDKILETELINAKNDPNTSLFNNVYVVIKDPKNGDILAMSGKGIKKENDKYITYDLTPEVITNSMTPGSVIKGSSILVGYKEGAIDIGNEFIDNCIKIYNYPKKCSWKRLGVVNDIKALSLSSNVYQFKTALKVANIDYNYNMKIENVNDGFQKYRIFFKEIGLGSKTNIDLPIDGVGNIGKSSSPDLYLNYVIGQYDTYTTMQLSEYISTIANDGVRVYPHLLKEVRNSSDSSIYLKYSPQKSELSVDKKYIARVKEGFSEVMKTGLGKNFMGNVNNPSGKTGTSETFYDSNNDGVIDTPTVSNAFVGYYPSDNPKMSIAITFPNIMRINGSDERRSYANKKITKLITEKFAELYG